MWQYLRVRQQPVKVAPDPGSISVQEILSDFTLPLSIRGINGLPENAKRRFYRMLVPPRLLTRMGIHPVTWKGQDGSGHVILTAEPESNVVNLSAKCTDDDDPFFSIQLSDNNLNGIDLNWVLLNDPSSPRFQTDYDEQGRPTYFGTVRRNLAEEERAMRAGLAPGQIRASLHASRDVVEQLDAFLALVSHHAVALQPLTFASAWVFERRGFAYMIGHKLMDDIHSEFQPGGALYRALDGSTAFRQPDQWRTVRGRAWAIHDGILSVLGTQWDGLRMVKQVGRHAGVNTQPDASF